MPYARQPPAPPPWEALHLIASFLDAASLAAASCVSTSWRTVFAADHLWAQLCRSHYPASLHLLLPEPDHPSPHRRLFALFHSASTRRLSLPAPRLTLADVAFALDVFTGGESVLSFAVSADEAGIKNAAEVFQLGVDVRERSAVVREGEWGVRWTVVRKEFGAPPVAVALMDVKVAKAGMLGGGTAEVWVVERLPATCGGARLEAEVVIEVGGEEAAGSGRRRRVLEKVRLGVMCECRYVNMEEGLRYLEHFLL